MESSLRRVTGGLLSFWHHGRQTERAAYLIAALLLASSVGHLAVLMISGGTWIGPLSLRKPMTFGFFFGLTLITIVWLGCYHSPLRTSDAG